MGNQVLRVRLVGLLICVVTVAVAGLITAQNYASFKLDVAQAIAPEVTASVTPLPTFTALSLEVLAEHALAAARKNGFSQDLTIADLDLSQAVMTTYDQLMRYDGDYVHYYGILNPEVGVPDNRPVAIVPLSQIVPDGTGESTYERIMLFLLFADNGDLLYTVEMGRSVADANTTATPVPLIDALPPRDENGVLPLDYLLSTAYWSVKYSMPEDFTMEDMDLSQAVITTMRQWNAYSTDRSVVARPPESVPAVRRRPIFLMRFTGGDFSPIYLRPPGATPSKFDKAIITIWADTGEFFGGAYAEVGKPLMDLSTLKEHGLPFYIPTATPTPTP